MTPSTETPAPARASAVTIEVSVSDGIDADDYPDEALLQRWTQLALAAVGKEEAEVSVLIASSAEQQRLNRDYRGKDKPTNVLSFPTDFVPGVEGLPLGDIACCPDVINTEAQEQGKGLDAHWAHMMIHGVLHLAGYDHIDDSDAAEMEALEIKLLAQMGFENPYE